MIGDKGKLLDLKREKEGSIYFRDYGLAKILGKGIVSLGDEKAKEKMFFLLKI